MPYSLIWLPDTLLQAGLKVATIDGWEYRGNGDMGQAMGVLCHHTAGPATLNMPSLKTLIDGRPDLSGPLAQLGLGRDGTFYVISAGRCNHAGNGIWNGVGAGNTHFIGIEAENTGLTDDPWPEVQTEAYKHGVAAICRYLNRGPEWCAGHKEFALPQGRKDDPSFDMAHFRADLAGLLTAPSASLTPIPSTEPPASDGTAGRPTLRRPISAPIVKDLQTKLGLIADGNFGGVTEAAVREFQRKAGMVPDGIVGPATWAALDRG